jgi:hypothetical protein
VALQLTLAGWAVFELGVRVRERRGGRGSAARDRGTRALIALTLGAAIALAVVIGSRSTGPRIAGSYSLGVIVVCLGLAIRVWAIVALGRAFRTTVEVDSGQAIVSTGPVSVGPPSLLQRVTTGRDRVRPRCRQLACSGRLPLAAAAGVAVAHPRRGS